MGRKDNSMVGGLGLGGGRRLPEPKQRVKGEEGALTLKGPVGQSHTVKYTQAPKTYPPLLSTTTFRQQE